MGELHLPLLRFGRAYTSLDTTPVTDARTGETLCTLSVANRALVERDLGRVESAAAAIRALGTRRIIAIARSAAERFANDPLRFGPHGDAIGPERYLDLVSASTGLPRALCRRHVKRISHVLDSLSKIVAGLSRGLDPTVLDRGYGMCSGIAVRYVPTTDVLGVVLPNNSPGVNGLWLPALALQTPVALKPGHADPFTPLRLISALISAGMPGAVFGFYPGQHDVGAAIARRCGRAMVFGHSETVERFADAPDVSVHGPGFSKIAIAPDRIGDIDSLIPLLAESVSSNSGRSCINASTVLVPSRGDEVAERLAELLGEIVPRPLAAPDAELAGFVDEGAAAAIDARITEQLAIAGGRDVSEEIRKGAPRLQRLDGISYLLPTVVRCDDPEHPLARTEQPFPFVSVVELPSERWAAWIGSTLVLSVITTDERMIASFARSADVGRLCLGEVPTSRVRWDQPHEGNLFEQLWARASIQWSRPR